MPVQLLEVPFRPRDAHEQSHGFILFAGARGNQIISSHHDSYLIDVVGRVEILISSTSSLWVALFFIGSFDHPAARRAPRTPPPAAVAPAITRRSVIFAGVVVIVVVAGVIAVAAGRPLRTSGAGCGNGGRLPPPCWEFRESS